MSFKFNIGDRVRILDGSKIKGYAGGWCEMDEYVGEERIIVRQFTHNGHNAYELQDDWHTWDERGLERVAGKSKRANRQMEKITIYRDGNSVVAVDMRNGNKGVARCSPDDEFDFSVGAALAFDRLMKRGEDVVCEYVAAPPAKFKVGDRVIGNDRADHYGITTKGWIGRVRDVRGEFLDVEGDDNTVFTVRADCFDLYNGFLVGDKVKIIDTGRMYTTYVPWVVEHVHDAGQLARYAYDDDAGFDDGIKELDDTFTIRVIADDKAYIQQNDLHGNASWNTRCYLIDLCGLQRV